MNPALIKADEISDAEINITRMPNTEKTQLTAIIKTWAKALGFDHVGITNTDLSNYKNYFLNYLKNNHHGQMHYLEKNIEKRVNPEKLFPSTKSIICVGLNYFSKTNQTAIAKYALGDDYHIVIKQKLQLLAEKIKMHVGTFKYRICVDSTPLLEKALAEKAGLGWIGKNSLLINKTGSFFCLGELLTDLTLINDTPMENHCGDCNACIDACPMRALIAPYQLNASKCISYLTIEHRDKIPDQLSSLMKTCVYGCDVCQCACPWNSRAKSTHEEAFYPRKDLNTKTLKDFADWDEKTFLKNTKNNPISRIGYKKWRQNLMIVLKNSAHSTHDE